ncbi:MAG: hypothetical protein QM739_00075 [Propionivibrio sp.]
MKTNYVLIDYENVQPEAMAGLCEDHFKVLVFVGEAGRAGDQWSESRLYASRLGRALIPVE